ncbi:ABC transporter permease [Oceaniradius stylonematis]|uniref:ABC transporter permease n=2 Tax=Oceaniradius stylonematis TaxID=2184161 RepID=A0A3A8AC79_9HYPH|nr:ABC transporter permease [Oceaniradius stylonematis]RNC91279.1 MAG: ABC transporter permease [Oricola sp.]
MGCFLMPHLSRILYGTFVAATLFFLVAPVIAIIPMSFSSGEFFIYPLPGFSLGWYGEILSDARWQRAFVNSLVIGVSSAAIATVLGTLAALSLVHMRSIFSRIAFGLLLLPMLVPVVIVSVSLFYFYSKLGLVGTRTGLILGHATLGLPFVVVTVLATLRNYNFTLDRAALSLGAGRLRTFLTVTLPLIAPGVLSGAVFAFAVSLDEVVVTLFLASPEHTTLPREIFSGIRESISPAVVAAATVTIGLSCCLLGLLALIRR